MNKSPNLYKFELDNSEPKINILCTGGVSYTLFMMLLIFKFYCTKGKGEGRAILPPPPSPTGTKLIHFVPVGGGGGKGH
jgi:hypothetical protein